MADINLWLNVLERGHIPFVLYDEGNALVTGASNFTVRYSAAGAALVALGSPVITELGVEAPGVYHLALQAELVATVGILELYINAEVPGNVRQCRVLAQVEPLPLGWLWNTVINGLSYSAQGVPEAAKFSIYLSDTEAADAYTNGDQVGAARVVELTAEDDGSGNLGKARLQEVT